MHGCSLRAARTIAVAAIALAACGDDGAPPLVRCDALDDSAQPGLWWDERGEVDALAVDGERVYAGGFVRRADNRDIAAAAVWDGAAWTSLGRLRGSNETVGSIAIAADGAVWLARTYIGGDAENLVEVERCVDECATVFGPEGAYTVELAATDTGVVIAIERPSTRVVVHDGTTATDVPVEGARITSVAADGAGFCVAGTIAAVEQVPVENAACWDGAWTALGHGLPPATDLLHDGDTWYAVAGSVWRLEGDTWSEISAAVPGGCIDLAVAQGEIVCASGQVEQPTGEIVGGLRVLDDDGAWTLAVTIEGEAPDREVERGLRAVTAAGDRIVVGGRFCDIGGAVAVNIAEVALDGSVAPLTAAP
jgi:hypothetical protein